MNEQDAMDSEDDLLVAEYVLGVLPHEERVALARRLEVEGGLRERLAFWEDRLDPLAQDLAPVQPPAELLGAVERRLFGASPSPPGLWQSLGFWRALTAALFAALVIGAGVMFSLPRLSPTPPGGYVAQLASDKGDLKLAAFYDATTGVLKLNRVAGGAPQGRDLQLWLIAGKDAPVSLGVLPPQAMASFQLPLTVAQRLAPDAVLAVSDEPLGGSPTGQPTGAVLAAAPLDAI
jgi:anti-sigma-K factor RskA